MTRDDAVTRIQRILGFRTDKATEIQDSLKDTQVELEGSPFLPWFLLTEVSTASTANAEERVGLPTGFLREYEEDALYYFNSDDEFVLLVKDDISFLRGSYPGEGEPKAYALDDEYYRIFPTPDAVYKLKQIFYKADAVLSSNVENLWLKHAHDLMIGEAGLKQTPLLNPESRVEFTRLSNKGFQRLLNNTEARMHAHRRYVMGGAN